MATTKRVSSGRSQRRRSSGVRHASGRNGATAKPATLEAKLRRYVVREEARGAYSHFRDPAKALAELRKRAKKPPSNSIRGKRHAIRTAAA
ncbi:MAG: hypothetical protein ABSD58_01465 [Verrucomicrobiia bacterium]|jgi:hypothetical protein